MGPSILKSQHRTLKDAVGIRLAITQANGVEHEQVLHFTADEERQLRDLQTQFEVLLTKDTNEAKTNTTQAAQGLEDASWDNIRRSTLEMGEPICVVGARRIRGRNRHVSRFHHPTTTSCGSREARVAWQESGVQVSGRPVLSRGCLARTGKRALMNRSTARSFVCL